VFLLYLDILAVRCVVQNKKKRPKPDCQESVWSAT
jgi:hypothetical protein